MGISVAVLTATAFNGTSNVWVRKMDHDASRKHASVVWKIRFFSTPMSREKRCNILDCWWVDKSQRPRIFWNLKTTVHIYRIFGPANKDVHIFGCFRWAMWKVVARQKSGGAPQSWDYHRWTSGTCHVNWDIHQHDGSLEFQNVPKAIWKGWSRPAIYPTFWSDVAGRRSFNLTWNSHSNIFSL